jgi:hydroxyacylglutathione hydrolase
VISSSTIEDYALALAQAMILRPFLHEETACASYLFGCLSRSQLGVVDPHVDLLDRYLEGAERAGAPIAAVFETHVQADHVSGLPALVEATGATPYLPAEAEVEFPHTALADDDVVELGNTLVRAIATPGHAPTHHSYLVADRRRGTDEPWLVFTGDSLLVGDVGRPDLHAGGDPEPRARELFRSITRLLELPDHVLVYPSHFGGSVCGRALSANPFSSIGFERRHNQALAHADEEAFARALLVDVPPPPADQMKIVAANKRGLAPAQA